MPEEMKKANDPELAEYLNAFYLRWFFGASKIKKANRQYDLIGIDKWIEWHDNAGHIIKRIGLDEKIRFKSYGDFLCEKYSDKERQTPGWPIDLKKITDWIVYVDRNANELYMLPYQLLREACIQNIGFWEKLFGIKEALNYDPETGGHWITVSIPIPWKTVFASMAECIKHNFR